MAGGCRPGQKGTQVSLENTMTKERSQPETVLVHTEQANLVRAASVKDITGALAQYREIQNALDAQMPDCIMEIAGKKFRKKNYWRAIATAFNLDITVREEHRIEIGEDWGYLVICEAKASNGRVAAGDGSCMASEKTSETKGIFATVHNVRSHAHTRAYNRAVSNLVGFGEVSAEEIDHETRSDRKATDKQTKMLWAKAKKKQEDVGIAAEDILKDAYASVGAKSKQDVLAGQVDALVKFIEGYDPTQESSDGPPY